MFEPNNTDFATLILCTAENSTAETKREYPLLSTDRAVIGRAPDCEIALSPQEYITVSRRHAELKLITEAETSYWTITDLGTTNGTLVNGQTITEVHPLQSGDRIKLGYKGVEFLFQCQTLNNTVVAERTAIAFEPKVKAEKTVESVKIVIPTTPLEEAYPQLFTTNKTLWNLITPQVFWELPAQEPITAIAFSRDGELLAIASKDKTIKLWHIPSQTEIITLQETKSFATAIAFSPDRNIIATANSDKTIKLWQIETQQIIATFNGHKLAINSLAFSPIPPTPLSKGGILASGSSDKTIKLWDLASQTEITALTGHKSAINALAFSPDGQSLASGSNDKTIKFWNLATQEEANNIAGNNTGIQYLTYNSDGTILTSLDSDRVIRLHSLADKTEILAISSPSWQNLPIAISPLGIMVAGTDRETVVKLWHL
jgi:pSer/pThr/pTyr-binding forkhead associated (FHA) protein